MTRIPNWKKVKHINKEARRITRLAKKKRIKDVGESIIKKYKIPLYKKHVIKDGQGHVIRTKLIPITRKYKGQTKIRKRKIMDYRDFKNHYNIISKHNNKKLNLTVGIVRLITQINKLESKSTNLNKIANDLYKKLRSLKDTQSDSDQLDQQQNNMNNSSNMNDDQDNNDQNGQVDLDKNKDQDSDHHTNFGDQNFDPNNPSNTDFPPKAPGD